jgi:hypothetical protein
MRVDPHAVQRHARGIKNKRRLNPRVNGARRSAMHPK